MPKKGKKNKTEQEEEKSKVFKKLRNKHSAVESNINSFRETDLSKFCHVRYLSGNIVIKGKKKIQFKFLIWITK